MLRGVSGGRLPAGPLWARPRFFVLGKELVRGAPTVLCQPSVLLESTRWSLGSVWSEWEVSGSGTEQSPKVKWGFRSFRSDVRLPDFVLLEETWTLAVVGLTCVPGPCPWMCALQSWLRTRLRGGGDLEAPQGWWALKLGRTSLCSLSLKSLRKGRKIWGHCAPVKAMGLLACGGERGGVRTRTYPQAGVPGGGGLGRPEKPGPCTSSSSGQKVAPQTARLSLCVCGVVLCPPGQR